MMTRDQIERADKLLRQGIDLDRRTMRALVDHAMNDRPFEPHRDGCAWHRGAGCDCRDTGGELDLAVKQVLTKAAAVSFTFTCWKCSPDGWVSPPHPTAEARAAAADLHVRAKHSASTVQGFDSDEHSGRPPR